VHVLLLSRVEVLEQAAVDSTRSPAKVAIRSTVAEFMCAPFEECGTH